MELSSKTARELFIDLIANPRRNPFGFGSKPALINIDLQKAYTRPDLYPRTGYQTNPDQIEFVNQLSTAFRDKGCPVVWTYVSYLESGEDCGIWAIRSNTPDSLQNIKNGSDRAALDERLAVDHQRDVVMHKRMASAFFETNLASLLTFHRVDTLVLAGGSTSGCVRATAVEGISRGYRVLVAEECVADKHEGPHFANLYDIQVKYGDVIKTQSAIDHMKSTAFVGPALALNIARQ